MRKLALGLIALCLWVGLPVTAGAEATETSRPKVQQVFLVQNSGWMEPFYRDPRSKFRLLISSLVAQANLQGVDVIVASFNQDGQVPGQTSPRVHFKGAYDKAAVETAVQAIDLPKKASGAYADADFHGALKGAISRVLDGGEGVIWMVTNNKSSPDNSQDVIENTREFYDLLRTSPHISRIAAFPIRDDLSGPNFREKGFIVYAFAYGPNAGRALDVILSEGAPTRALFRSPPIKIKPLDREPVELRLTGKQADRIQAEVRNGALELTNVPGGKPIVIKLQGVLRNTYYPQNIDAAQLGTSWRTQDPLAQGVTVQAVPGAIQNVAALKDSGPVDLTLSLPAVRRQGPFFGIFDNERTLRGTLDIRLDGIRFSLAPDFIERISAISGTESIRQDQAAAIVSAQLPAVFLDYQRVSSATTSVPVMIMVRHSVWPMVFSLVGLAVVLLGGGFLLIWASRARTYSIPVGGSTMSVSVRPFEQRIVSDPSGTRATVRGAIFGSPNVRTIADDAKDQR